MFMLYSTYSVSILRKWYYSSTEKRFLCNSYLHDVLSDQIREDLILFYSLSLSIDSLSWSMSTIWSVLFDAELLCLTKHNFRRGINRTLPSQFLIKKQSIFKWTTTNYHRSYRSSLTASAWSKFGTSSIRKRRFMMKFLK